MGEIRKINGCMINCLCVASLKYVNTEESISVINRRYTLFSVGFVYNVPLTVILR